MERVEQGANAGKGKVQPHGLAFHERLLLHVIAMFINAWCRTLKFKWAADVESFMDGTFPPSVVIFWHNRLFIAPEFYRRYFDQRKLAVLISPSKDGAWPSAFAELLGIHPVRGSSKGGRSLQAVRDLVAAGRAGHDLAFTPDGSRGPMYDMKAGAVSVAMKTEAPIFLLSFNCERAWRLKSWDRFFLPKPFSRIEVRVDDVGSSDAFESSCEPKKVAAILKARLDAMTGDV